MYFVRCRASGHIKIGWSSKLLERCGTLNDTLPEGIDLLALILNADKAEERYLHRFFDDCRIVSSREWFTPAPQLLDHIEKLRQRPQRGTARLAAAITGRCRTQGLPRPSDDSIDIGPPAAPVAPRNRVAHGHPHIMRTADVLSTTGVGRTTLWRMEKRGEFPQRRQITGNLVGWLASEVNEWMQTRPQVVGP